MSTPFSYLPKFSKLIKEGRGNNSWWLLTLSWYVDGYFFLSSPYHKTKFPYFSLTVIGTYVSIMVYGSKVFRVSNFAQFRTADDIKKACMAMPKVANGVRKTGAALSAMVGNANTVIHSFSFQSLFHVYVSMKVTWFSLSIKCQNKMLFRLSFTLKNICWLES